MPEQASQRIQGDSIHVTMDEYDRIKRTIEPLEAQMPLTFAEEMQRCKAACSILGLQLFELQGKSWKVVIRDSP